MPRAGESFKSLSQIEYRKGPKYGGGTKILPT